MATITVHGVPDSLEQQWEEWRKNDIHITTGPYLNALEAVAKAADGLLGCVNEFGRDDYCGEYWDALDTAVAALKPLRHPDAPL